MKINEITVEQLNAAEETYRINNPSALKAAVLDGVLADKIMKSRLRYPVDVMDIHSNTEEILAFGIHLGVLLMLARVSPVALSPVVEDQVAS